MFLQQGCRHRRKGKRLYKGKCLENRQGHYCADTALLVLCNNEEDYCGIGFFVRYGDRHLWAN